MRRPKTDWDKTRIQNLLATNNKAVERGLIRIYMNQTYDEQASATVAHDNGIGFTSADSEFLTSVAQQVLISTYPEGKRLTFGQMKYVRPLMAKYWRQLREVIIEKETREKQEYAFTNQR